MQGHNPYAAPSAQPGFGPMGQQGGYGPQGMGPVGVRMGQHIIIPSGAQLPPVCVKCGSTDSINLRQMNYTWIPLHGRFFGIIGYLIFMRKAALALPLCPTCNSRWGQATWITIGAVFGGLLLWFGFAALGGAIGEGGGASIGMLLGMVAFFGLLLGAIFGVQRPRTLALKEIEKDQRIWLSGFHENAARAITGS
jgi:hypothetical protein